MKAIVHIEIDDEQRNQLAQILDGKPSKRLARRTEVVALAQGAIFALLRRGGTIPPARKAPPAGSKLEQRIAYFADLGARLTLEGNQRGAAHCEHAVADLQTGGQ